jgi:hypothetical protein
MSKVSSLKLSEDPIYKYPLGAVAVDKIERIFEFVAMSSRRFFNPVL